MNHNIKLHLAYDGSSYLGFQKTKEGPSIEGSLEQVLEKILQHEISLQAASRTDAGVHAEDQVINFFTDKLLDLPKLLISLNQLLPKDIRVLKLEHANPSFHPTLDSIGKEYHYHVSTEEFLSPFKRHYVWHFPHLLDLELMRKASNLLIGTHDFQAFTNARKPSYENTVRTVNSIEILQKDKFFAFFIIGENFLYKMVRNIVGTLCYIGCHKLTLDHLPDILSSRKRAQAGMTAPASGLFLHKIYYPPGDAT